MATHHAAPGDVVNLANWAEDLPAEHSKFIAKTPEMQLARLVLSPGDEIGNHHMDGPLVIQCINGSIDIVALGTTRTIAAGELTYLPAGTNFTMKSSVSALALMTFIFT